MASLKVVFGMICLERLLDQVTLKQPYRKGAVWAWAQWNASLFNTTPLKGSRPLLRMYVSSFIGHYIDYTLY